MIQIGAITIPAEIVGVAATFGGTWMIYITSQVIGIRSDVKEVSDALKLHRIVAHGEKPNPPTI